MSNLNKLSIAAAALLASTSMGFAADIIDPPLIDPPYVEEIPEVPHISNHGGWYLRGDLGFAHNSLTHVDRLVADDVLAPTYSNFSSADLDESLSIGVGVGYQINGTLRVDATLKHITDAKFTGDSSTSGGNFACNVLDPDSDGDMCSVSDTAEFSATTVMMNAYADLGTFSGFTPYVGAGLGGAHTHWTALDNDINCVAGGPGDCASDAANSYNTAFDGKHAAKNGWRFAYALHAGASYDLSRNVKIDAGYSFTHISGGDMYGFQNGSGVMGNHGDIKIHEVRAGLRYNLY
ncbi:MAG: outer membrane protein [Nitratireductor sp.]